MLVLLRVLLLVLLVLLLLVLTRARSLSFAQTYLDSVYAQYAAWVRMMMRVL